MSVPLVVPAPAIVPGKPLITQEITTPTPSVEFTIPDITTYRRYAISIDDVGVENNGEGIIVRLGNDGTIDDGGSDYGRAAGSAFYNSLSQDSDNLGPYIRIANNHQNESFAAMSGVLYLSDPLNPDRWTNMEYHTAYVGTSDYPRSIFGGGQRLEAALHDLVSIETTSGGDITRGIFTLYGWEEA